MDKEIIDLTNYDIEASMTAVDEEELKKKGYCKLPKDALSKIDYLMQYIPGHAAWIATNKEAQKTISEIGENAFKVVLKKGLHLGKSSAANGAFKGMAFSEEGQLNSVPDLVPIDPGAMAASMAPQLALGIFNAMSIATGQYFLSEINSKLRKIDAGINDIKSFLETDKKSESLSDRLTMEHIQRDLVFIMDNVMERQATSVELKRIKNRSMSNCRFYMTRVESTRNKLHRSSDFKTYIAITKDLEKDYPQYMLSVHNYITASFFDSVITGMDDPAYLARIYADALALIQNYEKSYRDSDHRAKAYIKGNPELNKGNHRGGLSVKLPAVGWLASVQVSSSGVEVIDKKAISKSRSKKSSAYERERKLLEACSDVEPLKMTADMIRRYQSLRNNPAELILVNNAAFVKVLDMPNKY